MTNDEIIYCGTMMKAASGMGLRMQKIVDNETQYQYVLIDGMTGSQIFGHRDRDKQIALMNTCKSLEKYLSP